MSLTIEYPVPNAGAATNFTDSERPIIYAKQLTNRFVNINGRLERRAGMRLIASGVTVPGAPNLTRIHEWLGQQGQQVLMVSDDNGNIYRYNTTATSFSQVRAGISQARLLSAQSGDRLIFVNGEDRNFYTDNGGDTFQELIALINQGETTTGTDTTHLVDATVSSWANQTLIANNDIVWNTTVSAYAIVTLVSANQLTHTKIDTTGADGIGRSRTVDQTSGQTYKIIDCVDFNIIPLNDGTYDNIAVAGPGTSQGSGPAFAGTNYISVSGINFATETTIKPFDFIYNTTRTALTQVKTVSASLVCYGGMTGQTAGDSLVFFKSAMPIASFIHVHYGRTYYIDARERSKVRISAADDAQDMTTFAKTLDASTYDFGSQQPQGENLTALGTFQGYLAAQGLNNVYIFAGINPIQDTSSSVVSFSPISVYPDGGVSPLAFATNGNDGVYMSPNGLQAINVGSDSFNVIQNNISEVNSDDFRFRIKLATPNDIQVTYYGRRQWIICKLGSVVWNLNISSILNEQGRLEPKGSWSLFTGLWGQQNHFFVGSNGTLYTCGNAGKMYIADDGDFTDNGQIISTNLTTARYFLEEPQRTNRIKRGYFIRPIFESGGNVPYTVAAAGGWEAISNDQIVVTANGTNVIGNFIVATSQIGGTSTNAQKRPLRWRGENVELTFTTSAAQGPDIISSYSLYGEISGRR